MIDNKLSTIKKLYIKSGGGGRALCRSRISSLSADSVPLRIPVLHIVPSETLTLFPIDTRLIDFSLMNNEEINWLNDYHRFVLENLRPQTPHNQLSLLERLTKPVE